MKLLSSQFTEKESRIAELNSDMEIKQAEAGKKAAIGRNEAQKAVAQNIWNLPRNGPALKILMDLLMNMSWI